MNLKTYILVLLGAGVIYGLTCAPGVLWQDSGMIQYRVWHNDIEGSLGLALAHPLYYLMALGAKQVPVGEFGHRINLMTALISAVAIANIFLLVSMWTRQKLAGLVAALSLMLSHSFWRHGAICETDNLFIALLLGELIMLLQYCRTEKKGYLYGLGFLNGLALAQHMMALFGFVCYGIFLVVILVQKKIRIRHMAVIGLFWIVGALPYEYLVVKTLVQTGDWAGTISSALFGASYQQQVLNTVITGRIIKENFLYLALNFPTPNILLAGLGIWVLLKKTPERKYAVVFGALMLIFLGFASRYTVVDRYSFFIPFYTFAAVLIGLGAGVLAKSKGRLIWAVLMLVCTVLPIGAYAVGPVWAKKMDITLGTKRVIPYRDDYKWFLQPWRCGEKGPGKFARESLEGVPEGAVIYADNTTVYPLLYMQEIKGIGRQIKVVSAIAGSEGAPELNEENMMRLAQEKKLYVVTPQKIYCPDYLLENCVFKPAGKLYKVVPHQE